MREVEEVEARVMLTAVVLPKYPDVLTVYGRIRYDEIVISLRAGDASKIDVRIKQVVQTFDAAAINFIEVFARGSDDLIRIDDSNGSLTEKIAIHAGPGNDRVFGSSANEALRGAEGNDRLFGGGGNDVLYGNLGGDSLHGGDGDKRLLAGSDGDSTLFGDAGNDTLYGMRGRDALLGGPGDDHLESWRINDGLSGDLFVGGDGHDTLLAYRGDDTLLGDAGNDYVQAGNGADDVMGGDGVDTLIGGPGSDWFHISDALVEINDLDTLGFKDWIVA
jgi:Ca2+-binding RTX toxin-like protein